MAKKPETLFKENFRPRLKKIPRSWWFKVHQVALRGIPDFIGCIDGRFVALELKKDEQEKPAPLQLLILSKIKRAGGFTATVYPENAEQILAELMLLPYASERPENRPPER